MPRPWARKGLPLAFFQTNDDGLSTLKKSVAVPVLDTVRLSSVDPAEPELEARASPGSFCAIPIPSSRPLSLAIEPRRSAWPPGALRL